MDTVFIKMCDCPEIQERWEIREGDLSNKGVISELDTYYPDEHWDLIVDNTVYQSTELIWLPRQEDLQKMLGESTIPCNLIAKIYDWLDLRYDSNMDIFYPRDMEHFPSMEQLWLAFVMKEKHGKIWSESQWVKE